ncbi:GATA-4/5/6 transcription factors domain-containing protein, partial [Dioscorea alata]
LHARPCDGCIRRRARWYCAADDAFLCQCCDASIHSANPLARRHERLRLKTGSFSAVLKLDTPAWQHGITRKARTPRPKPAGAVVKSEPLVPDLETVSADENNSEEEQLLLYCVPVLDHSPSEKPFVDCNNNYLHVDEDDAELTEFAADMERLLGPGLDEDVLSMEGLGFLDLKEESNHEIKMEIVDHDDQKIVKEDVDLARESLEMNIDCGSVLETTDDQKVNECLHGKRLILRLDYEKVMTAWASCNGLSPWGDGERPVINLNQCWPAEFVMGGVWGGGGGGGGGEMGQVGGGDGGREARVTRYREKRRTRLFAKKIRYEVRKLNAEKRPRMKGRFVKRVSSY